MIHSQTYFDWENNLFLLSHIQPHIVFPSSESRVRWVTNRLFSQSNFLTGIPYQNRHNSESRGGLPGLVKNMLFSQSK